MWLLLLSTLLLRVAPALPLNLNYLDPIKLQTVTTPQVQKRAALNIIQRYTQDITVEINPKWFTNNKDTFYLKTSEGVLNIQASTGVAAVWGFNYYLKKYCKSQIEWQTYNVRVPTQLPNVNETVVANDRFRYYQNVCTASYSFVWWNIYQWKRHLKWMALNGINLSLAPVAQEAIWARVYRQMGMTQEQIDKHFTGPAFLSWLRMGNIHSWGGPLPKSWHNLQTRLQTEVIESMLDLGIVPVLPAFNGHVPEVFSKLYPNSSFHKVKRWSYISHDYCCGAFIDPHDPMFKIMGTKFLNEMGKIPGCHIFHADPFNEVILSTKLYTDFVTETARIIFLTISKFDEEAVWLLQNWMFVSAPRIWPKYKVQSMLLAIPNGRVLILDLEAEKSPKYNRFDMYFGQPFIWCMLHNYGGTLGMFGNMVTINEDVHEVRSRVNSTMIGIGLTPEGINQNYVVYDLMLESAWRKSPVKDLNAWAADYAERRYRCNATVEAWQYLLKSVYSYNGIGRVDGSHIITKNPGFKYMPWAWYKSSDLFQAFKKLVFINDSSCNSKGYRYDVVDVTREVLQYRIDQLFVKMMRNQELKIFNATVYKFLEAFDDMALVLSADPNFRASTWFSKARALGRSSQESDLYEENAWIQITRWGPNKHLNDYACKQWSEMVSYYYKPGWAKFLFSVVRAKERHEEVEKKKKEVERSSLKYTRQSFLRSNVFHIDSQKTLINLAQQLYYKWYTVPGVRDLRILTPQNRDHTFTLYEDGDLDEIEEIEVL